MISAVSIDNLDKQEAFEHFFNDVKYATISLDKDLKQVRERFVDGIEAMDYQEMKKRLGAEYTLFIKPTYKFMNVDPTSLSMRFIDEYREHWLTILKEQSVNLNTVVTMCNQLQEMGLLPIEQYASLQEFILMIENINKDICPTKYWFEPKKYDFIMELIDETQNNVENFIKAQTQITASWAEGAWLQENAELIQNYLDKKDSGLKVFDVNFHKAKKLLKDLYIDDTKALTDEEVQALQENIMLFRKCEFWLSRNRSRIQQFLGEAYQQQDTDFAKLRKEYAIIVKLSQNYLDPEKKQVFLDVIRSQEGREHMEDILTRLCHATKNYSRETLIQTLPWNELESIDVPMSELANASSGFCRAIECLTKDYDMIFQYLRYPEKEKETFQFEDLKKTLYLIERIQQKQEWFEENKDTIQDIFGERVISAKTDWNALREELREEESDGDVNENPKELEEAVATIVPSIATAEVEQSKEIQQNHTVDTLEESQVRVESNPKVAVIRVQKVGEGNVENTVTLAIKPPKKQVAKAKKKPMVKKEQKIQPKKVKRNIPLEELFPIYIQATREEFLKISKDPADLERAMRYVLETECPVKEEIFYKRLAICLDLVRISPKKKIYVQQLLEEKFGNDYSLRDGYFFSNSNQEIKLRTTRKGEEKRDIGFISIPEIKAGVLAFLTIHEELTLDEISKEIADLFYYPRRTQKFCDVIDEAVKELKREGKIVRLSGGFCLI